MASTATARLGLEKQGTGENNNSWGTKLNTTGLDLIDAAIAGMASYTLSGPKTLTSGNYVANEARMPFQNITGGTGGTVTIPSLEGRFFVRNNSSGAVVFTTGSGVTASFSAGDAGWAFCDGTNVYTDVLKSYVDTAIANAAFGGISLGAGVQTWLQTPSSANLLAAMTTKTGTGSLVFSVSPALTGTPIAPTASAGTNTTQIATCAFVAGEIAAVGAVTASSTTTFTNKNVNLSNNTLTGTKALFNTACSDGDFVFTDAIGSTVQAYDSDLASIAALTTTSYGRSFLDRANAAAALTYVGATTVGANLVTQANPGAVRYNRINADNTVSQLDAASFLSAIGGAAGTVTSVAALTIGTSGTDLSSSVANGSTTPVITLNVPTASASARGALSSTDWSTFNGKQAALVSGTNIKTVNSTSLLGSGDIAVQATLVSGTNIKSIGGTSLLGSGDITSLGVDISGNAATATTATTSTYASTITGGSLAIGPLKIPAYSGSTTFTAAIVAGHYYGAGPVTIPSGVFSAGDAFTIVNSGGGAMTINQGSGTTLTWAETGGTGNRTLSASGMCSVLCVASNTFRIAGTGLS